MKFCKAVLFSSLTIILLNNCSNADDSNNPIDSNNGVIPITVSLSVISGVIPPAYGETPVTTITDTEQYTGTVSWYPAIVSTFAGITVYTATITLMAKSGYTLTGVPENFFSVTGASVVSNNVDSGVVTASFPQTGSAPPSVINIKKVPGVTVPVIGEIPVSVIAATEQYTGTVSWNGEWAWSNRFSGAKAYSATITLTAKAGYTLTGVASNYFEVAGASSVSNTADTGIITAEFPATVSVTIGDNVLGGKVAYILQNGDPGYVAGEQRGLIVATVDQSASIVWSISPYQSTSVPGGTGNAIGTGKNNTNNIILQNGNSGSYYAARLAREYRGGGYTDWFLPSKNELQKIYINRVAIGNFDITKMYWSSTEYNSSDSWCQIFGTGNQFMYFKENTYSVRATRLF